MSPYPSASTTASTSCDWTLLRRADEDNSQKIRLAGAHAWLCSRRSTAGWEGRVALRESG